jgi:lipopolysaccharide/colanic/teichoic acid biosynthesis glycosyltransferase
VIAGVRTRNPLHSRAFDLVVSLLLVPLTLPLAALVALAVALDSPGPVLYRSTRVGRDGRRFQMLKFRTMAHCSAGPSLSLAGDERYTPFGRVLAASRLDELPQILNVLVGDMRLVGPRPEVEQFVLDQAAAYRQILAVPPGITGPTQLEFSDEGRRLAAEADPERAYREQLLPDKVVLDLHHVASVSLREDCKVLARTCLVPGRQIRRVLPRAHRGRGAHAAGRLDPAAVRGTALVVASCAMVAAFALQGTTGV